jgi:hypothetical protein
MLGAMARSFDLKKGSSGQGSEIQMLELDIGKMKV